jgi:photosystem II stability/assembly factor-like uncharacterized protein
LLIEHPAMAPPPVSVVAGRARRYRLRRRLRAGVAVCAAAALVAGGVAWRSAESVSGPQSWAAAGPARMLPAPAVAAVPSGPAPAGGRPGAWRLASYLSEPLSWRRTNGGPAPGYLSCPAAGTCYLAGSVGGGSSSGPGQSFNILYVSHDSGLSWTAIRMAGGASFTTALACPAVGDCLAGGEIAGRAVLLATGDGGLHWSYRALPPGDGVINELGCPAWASCRAVASQSPQPGLSGPDYRTWFLRTDDAGSHWSAVSFPTRDTIGALSCPSAADCVAVGSAAGSFGADLLPPGVALRTTDGGRTWAPGMLPSGMSFFPFSVGSVTCAGTSTCYTLGLHPERYHPSGAASGEICVSGPTSPDGHGCKPPAYIEVGAAAVSGDGGASWQMLALPPRTPEPSLFDISCPTARDCWIAGEQAVPQVIPGPGGGYNGSSAMILATTDGGASWSKTTFAAGRLADGQQTDSLMAVGQIACPAVNSCLGIGMAEQGSYHTPVYTNAGG